MPQGGLRISPVEDGATFGVKVVPRASRDEIAGIQQGALRVRLTAPPVEGAANRALVGFVASDDYLDDGSSLIGTLPAV